MSEEAQGAEVPAAAPAAGGDAASVHGSQVGSAVGSRAASIAGDVAPVGQIGGEPGPGSVANESVHGAATHAPRVPVKLEDVVAKATKSTPGMSGVAGPMTRMPGGLCSAQKEWAQKRHE